MRGIFRYLTAFVAVLCILTSAMLALFWCVTTEEFALAVNGSEQLIARQQLRINKEVDALTARWQLSEDLLTPWAADAAREQRRAVAAWWGALWQDPAADTSMPVWLDGSEETRLVSDVRGDAGFIAMTQEDQRRAIARDQVAYALDEAVCDAVMPLRRSIVEMGLALVSDIVPLPMVRQAAMIGACALLAIALVLLLLAHKAVGSALVASGAVMALVGLWVWLMHIPALLGEMNTVAQLQGELALATMGKIWCKAAGVLVLLGLLILLLKRVFRRGKKNDPVMAERA